MKIKYLLILCFSLFVLHSISQTITDSIYSKNLNQYRIYTLHNPDNFNPNKNFYLIYMTDGEHLIEKNYIPLLDSLMSKSIIPQIIIAGEHSVGTSGNRYNEYVNYKGDTTIYNNHQLFFINEFIPYIEKKLNLTITKENRVLYGFSNGASFVVDMTPKHTELFNNMICCQLWGYKVKPVDWDVSQGPKIHIGYGKKDSESSIRESLKWNHYLDSAGVKNTILEMNQEHSIEACRDFLLYTLRKHLK